MATIYVGSARIDERGKLSGGQAGDQKQTSSTNDTKGEVSMQPFYVHSKGWYILRPKKISVANKMAKSMTTACNNSNLGYDQSNRLGVITYGVNTKTKTECDCSSLVRACIIESTGKDVGNFSTWNEADILEKSGLFEKRIVYVNQTKTPVYNGDVLVTKTKGHTVIVVSGNPRKSVSTDKNNKPQSSDNSTDTKKETKPSEISTKKFKVKITVNALNIRQEPNADSKKVGCITNKGTYTITKTSGSWGYLKSGAGWINISTKYVKYV